MPTRIFWRFDIQGQKKSLTAAFGEVQLDAPALPDAHRAVFELAVLGELGYAEIGALLGIPVGTVKSRMFHAVRRLRAAWAEAHGTEGAA